MYLSKSAKVEAKERKKKKGKKEITQLAQISWLITAMMYSKSMQYIFFSWKHSENITLKERDLLPID